MSAEFRALRALVRRFPLAVGGAAALVVVAVICSFAAPRAGLAVLALLMGANLLGLLVVADRSRRSVAGPRATHTSNAAVISARSASSAAQSQAAADKGSAGGPAPRFATQSEAGDPQDRVHWTREEVFAERYSQRGLDEFCASAEPVAWEDTNPYVGLPTDELRARLRDGGRWRYHHGLAEVRETPNFYEAYALRVDAMLDMIDRALSIAGVAAPAERSFVDIGAAEGYVTNWLLDRGVTDVDAIELNVTNIQRMWIIRALKNQKGGRIGRVDLEKADWSRSLGRRYDVTLALGVIYHMENPLLFARNLYALTDEVALVESDTPVYPDNAHFRGWGNIHLHRDQVTLEPGNVRYLTEMRPDRQALAEMLLAAGFREVHAVPAGEGHRSRYFDSGEKSLLVALR